MRGFIDSQELALNNVICIYFSDFCWIPFNAPRSSHHHFPGRPTVFVHNSEREWRRTLLGIRPPFLNESIPFSPSFLPSQGASKLHSVGLENDDIFELQYFSRANSGLLTGGRLGSYPNHVRSPFLFGHLGWQNCALYGICYCAVDQRIGSMFA